MNYFDILLAKKLEDDRDPKVEGLSVTENGRYHEDGVVYDPVIVNVPETPLSKLTVTQNGTYTAPTGTGYNEVDVDVPLPENAYLLKEIEDVEIASFNDGSDLSMPKLEVAIEPVQEGSGDPSPTNIRPISGWDEVNITVADDLENPTVSNVYTIDLDGTRYGGKLDVVNGVLTVDRVKLDLGSRTYNKSSDGYFYCFTTDLNFVSFDKDNPNAKCEIYKLCTYAEYTSKTVDSAIFGNNNSHVIYIADSRFTDVNDLKTALNGVQLVYELATPLTIQLSPTVVKSLRGVNNVFADSGNILDLSYLAKEE